MTNSPKKSPKQDTSETKENVAKVLTAVGVVGMGAALFAKRDKVKQLVLKLLSKVKKAS